VHRVREIFGKINRRREKKIQALQVTRHVQLNWSDAALQADESAPERLTARMGAGAPLCLPRTAFLHPTKG